MRQEFSARTKAIAFNRCGGKCDGCGAHIYPRKFHYDHIRPDALLGAPESDNCQVLCLACHGAKTGEDRKRIAKALRQERAHIGAKTRKGRPLPGSRASGWKRKINGGWERRDG